jgi:UDP-glucose-4-epimerase GalE
MPRNNILVTGGAGYIGSHAVKALVRNGLQPVVLDNLVAGNRSAAKWGHLIEGDISDEALIRQVIARYQIRAVIHFAGSAYIGESMQNPRKYFRNNVTKSLQFLDAILDGGVQQIVFSSTCATYGIPKYLPIDENHPQLPVNPYGESKLFIEKTLKWYGQTHGIRSVLLRYFNAAGADPDGEVGESHKPETHLIPNTIRAALGFTPGITVFGTDFPTPDGTPVRDYVHVTDLADAHVRALSYLEAGGQTAAFNLGTGTGYSVRDVIRSVERIAGHGVCVVEEARRPGDPAALIASADEAKRVLGWNANFRSLDEIVATAWQWHANASLSAAAAI